MPAWPDLFVLFSLKRNLNENNITRNDPLKLSHFRTKKDDEADESTNALFLCCGLKCELNIEDYYSVRNFACKIDFFQNAMQARFLFFRA